MFFIMFIDRCLVMVCLSSGIFFRLFSIFFMNSIVNIFVFSIGKLKFSPNCMKLCKFFGMSIDDKFINHLSLTSSKDSCLSKYLFGSILISKLLSNLLILLLWLRENSYLLLFRWFFCEDNT